MKVYELIKHLEVLPDQQVEIFMMDGEYGPTEITGVDDEAAFVFLPTESGTVYPVRSTVKCII